MVAPDRNCTYASFFFFPRRGRPHMSREEWAKPRGRKLNAGIAASRARRSRCPARSGHRRDPNGRAPRNRDNTRRTPRTSPPPDHACADGEVVLSSSGGRPAIPETNGGNGRPWHRDLSQPEPGVLPCRKRSIEPTLPVRSRLKISSFCLAPIRTYGQPGRSIRRIRSRRCGPTTMPVSRARAVHWAVTRRFHSSRRRRSVCNQPVSDDRSFARSNLNVLRPRHRASRTPQARQQMRRP